MLQNNFSILRWAIFSSILTFSGCQFESSNNHPVHMLELSAVAEEWSFSNRPIEQLIPISNLGDEFFYFLAFHIDDFENRRGFYSKCILRDTLFMEQLPYSKINFNQDRLNVKGDLLRINHNDLLALISTTDSVSYEFNFLTHNCFPAWLTVPTVAMMGGWLVPVESAEYDLRSTIECEKFYKNAFPVVYLSVEDSLSFEFFGSYPKSYAEKEVYGYDMLPFLAYDSRDAVIMSFPGASEILVGSLGGRDFNEIKAASYFDRGYSPMDREDFMMLSKAIEFQLETPKYGRIIHNPWTGRLYRFYHLPKNEFFNSQKVTHSVLILDDEFQVLSEFVFNELDYNPELFLAHPKGLMAVQEVGDDKKRVKRKLVVFQVSD